MAVINVPTAGTTPFTPQFQVIDHGEQPGSYSTISYIINGIEYVEEDLTKQREPTVLTYVTTYLFEPNTLEVFCNGLWKSEEYDYYEVGGMSFKFVSRTADIAKWLKPDGIIKVKYVKKRS